MPKLILILGLFLCHCNMSPVKARHLHAESFPFASQLPSNEMTCIFQDRTGFIWIGTTNGLARYDGYALQTFQTGLHHPEGLTDNRINCLAEDRRYLWVGTSHGLSIFDKRTYRMQSFAEGRFGGKYIHSLQTDAQERVWLSSDDSLFCLAPQTSGDYAVVLNKSIGKNATINSLYTDSRGTLWLCSSKGLFSCSPTSNQITCYPSIGTRNHPSAVYQDKEGRYWVATWGEGLWRMYLKDTAEKTEYSKLPIENPRTHTPDERFFSMVQDESFGYLWALSYHSLYALRMPSEGEQPGQIALEHRIDVNKMYTQIIRTQEGNLWLSSYDGGTIVSFPGNTVENYPLHDLREKLQWTPNLLTLCIDKEEDIWFNQDRFGICLYRPSDNELIYGSDELQKYTLDARVMTASRALGGIWTADAGAAVVYHLGLQANKLVADKRIDLRAALGIGQRAEQMLEDGNGTLWLLAQSRIAAYNGHAHRGIVMPDSLQFVRFALDAQNRVWAFTAAHRLYRLDRTGTQVQARPVSTIPLSDKESIRHLCIDRTGRVWLATSTGRVWRSDAGKLKFKELSNILHTQGHTILNLLTQGDQVWVVTHHRIIRYDISQQLQMTYSPSTHHMTTAIFRDQATCISGQGVLYAGGNGGIVSINPSEDSRRKAPPHPVVLSDFKLNMQSLFFSDEALASETAPHIRHITLPAGSRNLSIDFSALQYTPEQKVRYAYRMEGADPEWVYLAEGVHTAFYHQLNKGTYHFMVKTTDEHGKWSQSACLLTLEKLPAWYETIWAYLSYGILLLGTLMGAVRMYTKRLQRQNALRLLEALTQTKLDYFTNVSHELLTPLTLISCISNELGTNHPQEQSRIAILHNNVYRLKRLLQQVLDFRKTEKGQMTLQVQQGELTSFVNRLCQMNFLPLATQKQIRFQLHMPQELVPAWIDFDKTDKMLYNLLSNAIKYTPAQKSIALTVNIENRESQKWAVFRIADEGIGIPPKEQARIFTRFYIGSNGKNGQSNGIGLALTKELAELHHGTVSVESEIGRGSCFTLELPIDRAAFDRSEIRTDMYDAARTADDTTTTVTTAQPGNGTTNTEITTAQPEGDVAGTEETLPTVLLVDDNRELLDVMARIFGPRYRVATATNGQEALHHLETQAADVIVSDVMMPVMDGITFCRKVKSQLSTSHIPVIMLTAKQEAADQIACYHVGANGFITKPFEMDVLLARIDNLLEAHKSRQKAFRIEDHIRLSDLEYQPEDTQFLQDTTDLIQNNLAENDFGLDRLAEGLHLSKSTLHRKLKSMTGLTPLEFIRNIRLKCACTLLSQRHLTVSEVAYSTGFSTPKYFTKCFKEEFGMTPSEYQQQTGRPEKQTSHEAS